jgi:hypothetical protein
MPDTLPEGVGHWRGGVPRVCDYLELVDADMVTDSSVSRSIMNEMEQGCRRF